MVAGTRSPPHRSCAAMPYCLCRHARMRRAARAQTPCRRMRHTPGPLCGALRQRAHAVWMVRCEVSSLPSDRCPSFSIITRAGGGAGSRSHCNRRWRGAVPLFRVPCICAPIMREEDALWGILLGIQLMRAVMAPAPLPSQSRRRTISRPAPAATKATATATSSAMAEPVEATPATCCAAPVDDCEPAALPPGCSPAAGL